MCHLKSSVGRRRHEVEIQAPVLAVRPGLTFAGQPIRGLGAGIIFGLASLADSLGMKMIWGEATASSAPFYEKVLQRRPVKDLFIIRQGALRGTKGTLFEGGHRVPFIARWPGKIKAGSESSALIAHLDMAATFAALTGVKVPAGACPDSLNVLPALRGEKTSQPVRENFVAHTGGTRGPFAMRQGEWKYIDAGRVGYGQAAGGAGPQLYNLAADLAETKNLATEKPEKVKEMQALLASLREPGGAPAPPAR